jgi:hypothetical protein
MWTHQFGESTKRLLPGSFFTVVLVSGQDCFHSRIYGKGHELPVRKRVWANVPLQQPTPLARRMAILRKPRKIRPIHPSWVFRAIPFKWDLSK